MPVLDQIEAILAADEPSLRGITHSLQELGWVRMIPVPDLWDIGRDDQSYWRQPSAGGFVEGCFRGSFHDIVLPQIPEVISQAQHLLDMNFLDRPDGDFQAAIAEGFRRLQANAPTLRQQFGEGFRPVIRMLVGVTLEEAAELFNISKLIDWFKATLAMAGTTPADFIADAYLATSINALIHWNHSKIVASDYLALVGGVNFWTQDYLRFAPVHDAIGLVFGQPVEAAHRFCTRLWSGALHEHASCIRGTFGNALPPAANLPPSANATPMRSLALGRLSDTDGPLSLANNASVTARIVAICQAQTQVRMSQQTLGGSPLVEQFDSVLCALIARSLIDGIGFDIVVSNEATAGYDGRAQEAVDHLLDWVKHLLCSPSYLPPRSDLHGWAARTLTGIPGFRRNPGIPRAGLAGGGAQTQDDTRIPEEAGYISMPHVPDEQLDQADLRARTILSDKLRLCRLGFSSNCYVHNPSGAVTGSEWTDGARTMPARNHAKIYIIDDTCFYFGSDNAYRSGSAQGLIEFGYLIEDAQRTAEFVAAYWSKLFRFSLPCRVQPFTGA